MFGGSVSLPPPVHPLFPPPGWLPLCTCGCGMHQLRLHNLPLLGGQAGRWKLGIGEFVIMPHHYLPLWQGTNSQQPQFAFALVILCCIPVDASWTFLCFIGKAVLKSWFSLITGEGSRWTINELFLGPSGPLPDFSGLLKLLGVWGLAPVDFWCCVGLASVVLI